MLQWKKKPGDTVAIDEILIEIETDKVVLEVPAPAAGVLVELVVGDGGTVASEQVIARIDTEGKAAAVAAAPAAAVAAPAAAAPVAALFLFMNWISNSISSSEMERPVFLLNS